MAFLRRFHFSWRISLIGAVLIIAMLRLSYWQWERYLAKEEYLAELDARLQQPVVELKPLLEEFREDFETLLHRRVFVSGTFDFEHEMVKRNRKDEADGPGVHVVTPLKLQNSEEYILVNRGYIPLSVQSREKRKRFQVQDEERFIALVKLSETPRSFLSPNDPPAGKDRPWVDRWLRVHIEEIEKQLPYNLLPIHLELIAKGEDVKKIEKELVKNSNTRNEIFYLSDNLNKVSTGELNPDRSYPAPAFSTVVPSATHLLYVFEWAFMAFLTFLICFGLQLRKPKQPSA